ncbi:MAG: hypothetical protein LBE12_11880 [Planctomycetaceae bacterium]|nr:hypothetical protein [Planctomycetaceae bacterium]
MSLKIVPTSPAPAADADNKTLAKVGIGENAIYSVTCSYNGNSNIRYATSLSPWGRTVFEGKGDNRKVYAVMLSKTAYDANFQLEDLKSIAAHECQHVEQHKTIKITNTNWRILDDNCSIQQYSDLQEADSECVELDFTKPETRGSWLYLSNNSRFVFYYKNVLQDKNLFTSTSNNIREATKKILQDIYDRIPKELNDMKYRSVNGYNWNIRAAPK